MEVVKNTRTVAVKADNINGLQDFTKSQNMHNSVFRYKLDTSSKICKALIYKSKHIFWIILKGQIFKNCPFCYIIQ